MNQLLKSSIDYAYCQYCVQDVASDQEYPIVDAGIDQGFARGKSVVTFRTIPSFGNAPLTVFLGDFVSGDHNYDLVIAVPFNVVSGLVEIIGPEEVLIVDRKVDLDPGNYRLVSAQRITVHPTYQFPEP